MPYLILLICFICSGCAIGAATSGYSLAAKTADDLKAESRKSIVDEAVKQSKEYTDQVCVKKEQK